MARLQLPSFPASKFGRVATAGDQVPPVGGKQKYSRPAAQGQRAEGKPPPHFLPSPAGGRARMPSSPHRTNGNSAQKRLEQ